MTFLKNVSFFSDMMCVKISRTQSKDHIATYPVRKMLIDFFIAVLESLRKRSVVDMFKKYKPVLYSSLNWY